MSELRPATSVLRPDSARPRSDAPPEVEPPTSLELEHIARHLASLPVEEGASLTEEPDLGVVMVRRSGSGPEHNYAAMPRWTSDGWRGSLARVRDRMRADGAWPSVLVNDRVDRPIGLAREMRSAGWAAVTTEHVLCVGHAAVVPHLDRVLRIEAVQPRSVAVHEAVERRVFAIRDDGAAARREAFAAALASGALRAYVVWAGDEPVAVARLSQGEKVAGLLGIGVVPERRRQGFGSLITIVATRAGLATGNRLVWLSVREGDDAAMGLYAGLGFRPAFSWTRWLLMKGRGPARETPA